MKNKLLALTILWFVCCNAGFMDNSISLDETEYTTPFIDVATSDSDETAEYVNVLVEGTTAYFNAIASTADTKMRVRVSTAADFSGTPIESTINNDGTIDVRTVTVTGLSKGTTYFYQVGSAVGAGAYTWVTPATGLKSFRTPVEQGSPFRFAVISDSHLSGNADMNPVAQKHSIDIGTVAQEKFGPGIKASNPDFLVWAGDEINPIPTEDENYIWNNHTCKVFYANLLTATASFGLPIYFAPGNHERDMGKGFYLTDTYIDLYPTLGTHNPSYSQSFSETYFIGTDKYPYTLRTSYIMSPQGDGKGIDGRYSFIDYGDARLIFLTPYPYSAHPQLTTEDCPYDLGYVQKAWYAKAVAEAKGKWVFVFIHQLPKGAVNYGNQDLLYTYGWGTVGTATNGGPYHEKGCNEDIFNPLVTAKARSIKSFVMVGHSHYYAHDTWEGIEIYTLPSPRRTDYENGNNSAQLKYYSGYTDAETMYVCGDRSSLVVDVTGNAVTVTGIKPDGTVNGNIPIDTYGTTGYGVYGNAKISGGIIK